MLNKRGQGLSTDAIILIVLGIVILVVLILGFTMGWSRLAPWLSSSNVDTIASACNVACSTSSTNDFCNVQRELKFSGKIGDLETEKLYTCSYLSNYPSLGISECSSIKCLEPCTGTLKDRTPGCSIGQSTLIEKQVDSSDTTATKICCVPQTS